MTHAYLPEKVANPRKMKRRGWAVVTDGSSKWRRFYRDVKTNENESVNDAFRRAVKSDGLALIYVVGDAPGYAIEERSE